MNKIQEHFSNKLNYLGKIFYYLIYIYLFINIFLFLIIQEFVVRAMKN